MAGILRSCGTWNVDSAIHFLIIAPGELCDKIFEALETTSQTKKYQITVHKCESVLDIINSKPNLHVDFILIAFDGRISQYVYQAESNIHFLDEFFVISGRICLINCYGFSNTMELTFHAANKLRDKYCIHLLSSKLQSAENLKSLGERILNLSEALIGIHSGIPDLNMLTSFSN